MATTVDRPKRKSPAQPRPARRPTPPRGRSRAPLPRRVPEPNRSRDRALAYLCLFGPAVAAILAALAALATVLVIVLAGSGVEPPATGAAEVVPANALLYVHVSTDRSRPVVRQALTVSQRLPAASALFATVTARLEAILGGSRSGGLSFASNVRPWLGKEAALAVLDTPGRSAGSLVVLDVRAPAAARRLLASVGARPAGTYRGITLFAEPSGTELALLRHYLVFGQAASVEAAIDVAQGAVRSLAANVGYDRAVAGAPADRVVDVYASAGGVRRALVPSSGVLGDLGAVLDQPGLSAASMSISPTTEGLRVDVRRMLVAKPGRRPRQFQPSLAGALPTGSSLLLDARGLHSSFPALLSAAARLGVAGRIGPLLSRLGSALVAQGVDVHQLLGLFSGETVVALTPGRAGHGPAPLVMARTSHPDQARAILANLEGPLTQVFAPPAGSPGVMPTVTNTTVAGVPAHELSLAPGFQLVYAVAHGLVVLSSGTGGVAAVFHRAHALSDAPAFQSAVGNHPAGVTSLLFFDLSRLLRLGEQAGFIDSTRNATLWPALEKIRAVGLTSWQGASDTTTQLQLQIP